MKLKIEKTMKTSYFNFALKILIVSTLLISCQTRNAKTNNESNEIPAMTADSVMAEVIPDSPNFSKNEATKNKKFIRTAKSKFRVKDVKHTTQKINDLTNKYGAYVTNMSLKSEPISCETIQVSADSQAEISTFTVQNDLIIRVPNLQLDSLLRDIFKLVEYWDSCEIKADEVTLSLLHNSLKIKKIESYSQRNKGNIDYKKGDISLTNNAEESVLNLQNQADNYLIDQKNTEDQVNFSTINLQIYQATTTQKTMLVSPKSFKSYRPNILLRLFDSLQESWRVLEELLVFLMRFWLLFVCVFLGYFLMKKYKKR